MKNWRENLTEQEEEDVAYCMKYMARHGREAIDLHNCIALVDTLRALLDANQTVEEEEGLVDFQVNLT